MKKSKFTTKRLVMTAMLACMAFVLNTFVHFPAMAPFQHFVNAMAAVTVGPWLGSLAGFLTGVFRIACGSDIGSITGAIFGLLCGSLVMIGIMLLWNWLITPLYMVGTSRTDIAGMLMPVFLPFNALKAGFNSAFTLCLYKPLTSALRRAKLLPQIEEQRSSAKLWIYILGATLLITCVVFGLALRGII